MHAHDLEDDDVLAGLRAPRKRLPCRLLYDLRGSQLFERICTLSDYYPTRAELALLAVHLAELAGDIGARARVIEPGSGAGLKTRMLLAALDAPTSYVPIDISREQLEATADAMRAELPRLAVQPVHGDYTAPLELPAAPRPAARTLVFFPGSTLGNFEPDAARDFLARMRVLAGANGALLLGTDSNHDPVSLLRAYDDVEGVTAAFDLNVLAHVNRTHDATFALERFAHRAIWRRDRARIEMHLASRCVQYVHVAGEQFHFACGESIVTEHCYKHDPVTLSAMLSASGWRVGRVLVDHEQRVRLWLAFASPRDDEVTDSA
jgi:dimethylhistidine N-methyltransferase